MKYICLGYIDPGKFEGMTQDERQATLDECFEYNDHLRANGHLVAELPLQPPETAVTLYWKNGKVAMTDGPYAETKEQVGGIQILEARDLNHAIQLISQQPGFKNGLGPIEIRPVADLNEMMKASEQRRRKDTSPMRTAMRERMISKRMISKRMISITALVVVISIGFLVPKAAAQSDKYSRMAPVDQSLMERNAEILLARSAAPDSISSDATIRVLGRQGYETAVRGRNGFVCMVERSWMAAFDSPEYRNPKVRGAECLNRQAARSTLPIADLRTRMVLAGTLRRRSCRPLRRRSTINNCQISKTAIWSS
ncbi:MAG: YciI family protein [Candidatus Sulfotelmatobacter sp.]